MIQVITFCDENMTISANKLKDSAYEFGASKVKIYMPEDLDPFFTKNILEPILKDSRGFGWWVWKPYIILDAINKLSEGDTLIYSDAGQEIVGDLIRMQDFMDEDIMMFTNGFQHSHWCKREVAKAIDANNELKIDSFDGLPYEQSYYAHKQVQASFILFKVTDEVKKFIQEWFAWSVMPGFIDNTPRGQQFPEFQESRHDQAIITCLQIKYGYHLNWFPSHTNLHQGPDVNTKYGIKIIHHRKRNNEW